MIYSGKPYVGGYKSKSYILHEFSDFTGRFLKSPKCELCNIAFVNCHRESRLLIMPIDVGFFFLHYWYNKLKWFSHFFRRIAVGSKSQDKPMERDPVVLSQRQRYVSSCERGTGTYISTGLNISTQNINLACI